MLRLIIITLKCFLVVSTIKSQSGYGNQWLFGYFGNNPSGVVLDFNDNPPIVVPVDKEMEIGSSSTIMCDTMGRLLFYSNGCYIANSTHQMMANGDAEVGGVEVRYRRTPFGVQH